MLKIIKKVFKGTYYPLNKIILSRENLLSNYKYLFSINPKIKISPVLKSNAYGHGIIHIAKILESVNPPFFCVDSLYEAYELSKAKIKSPILIMGYIDPENLKVKRLPFSYAAYDLKLLKAINYSQKEAQVHIKVDTGMHRLGIPLDDLAAFLKEAIKFKNIEIVGLMSHLASGDKPHDLLTQNQIRNFQKAQQMFSSFNIKLKWTHLAATDGLMSFTKQIASLSNIARVGLGIYGIYQQDHYLKPVLELKSQLVQVKQLKRGDFVGYSGTFRAKNNMKLGILPIGYNDGMDCRLSNKGFVQTKSQKCRVLGRVSMNITAIDITGVRNPRVGDDVTVFSKNAADVNSIENSAKICKTIPYELLIHLSPTTIRREVV